MSKGRVKDGRFEDFEAVGFFVVRAPLFAFDELVDWNERATGQGAEAARAKLQEVISRDVVREAILVASPSLFERLDDWVRDPSSESGVKVERAIIRYFTRMTSRPTPFGLFAGCGLGRIAERTEIRLTGASGNQRRTRLDNDYLSALAASMFADRHVREQLRLRTNTTAYQVAGQVRYAHANVRGKSMNYDLLSVAGSVHLTAALDCARDGAKFEEIVRAIVAVDRDVTLDDAHEFVHELADAQILTDMLGPAITGDAPIDRICGAIEAVDGLNTAAEVLRWTRAAMAELDGTNVLHHSPAAYASVCSKLAELNTPIDQSRLFQVDSQIGIDYATLAPELVSELVRAAILWSDAAPWSRNEAYERFCAEFATRYGDAEVPLLEVLDDDIGIGFDNRFSYGNDPTTLLRGIHFSDGKKKASGKEKTKFDSFLKAKLQALGPGERELRLTESDLAGLKEEDRPLPDAFSIQAMVLGDGPEAVAAGNYRLFLSSIDGPSGANWLARFCHVVPGLAAQLEQLMRREEELHPGPIFAEIVHLPEGRMGNILARPLLRPYEIVYSGCGGAAVDYQLCAEDLLVSVRHGRATLRSRRLQREIVPRLASAHRHTGDRNLPVYKLLGAMQAHSFPGCRLWSWGVSGVSLGFLPRVTMGRVVLSLAEWRIDQATIKLFDVVSLPERRRAVASLRDRLGLPRCVSVADGDNVLPIDFENELSVDAFTHLIKGRRQILMIEQVPSYEDLCATGPDGRYAHELIIPVVRKRGARDGAWVHATPHQATGREVRRRFTPGSEWLYAKVSLSPRMCDNLLCDLTPVIAELRRERAFQRWFFVREVLPEWNLRLRFHGEPAILAGRVWPRLCALLDRYVEGRLAWRVELDTYDREIERYGGPDAISIAEAIFCADSDAALAALQACTGASGPDVRWRVALLGVDAYLNDFGLVLDEKIAWASEIRGFMGREAGLGKELERELGAKFRTERADLEELLWNQSSRGGSVEAVAEGIRALRARSERVRDEVAALRQLANQGRLTSSLAQLAPHLCHMHVNRLLCSSLRQQELVLWDFLLRLYQSARIRAASA